VIGPLLGKPGPAETLTHRRSRTGTGNSWHSPRACSSRLGKLSPKFRPVIFPPRYGSALPLGRSHQHGPQRGGCHDRSPERTSTILLFGRVRYGDCDCGRDLAHLSGSGPLPNWPLPYDPLSIDRVPANTVQRETEHYTTLTQMASASVKIISDTVAGWREAGHPLQNHSTSPQFEVMPSPTRTTPVRSCRISNHHSHRDKSERGPEGKNP
jgi:hypothetical protein